MLRSFLAEFAMKQDLTSFEQRMEPLLVGCEKTLLQYSKDNEDVRNAVLSFDQAFAQKASKFQMTELANQTTKEMQDIKA